MLDLPALAQTLMVTEIYIGNIYQLQIENARNLDAGRFQDLKREITMETAYFIKVGTKL